MLCYEYSATNSATNSVANIKFRKKSYSLFYIMCFVYAMRNGNLTLKAVYVGVKEFSFFYQEIDLDFHIAYKCIYRDHLNVIGNVTWYCYLFMCVW